MTTPRIEIDVEKIRRNASTLVALLADRGIAVTGVTKSVLGSPQVAAAFLHGGVTALGDSRLDNIEAMRRAGLRGPMRLIRSPTPSQADRVVRVADLSFVTEIDVIRSLSAAASARGVTHGIVVMVELGDLREGLMPDDVESFVAEVLALPGLSIEGLGTNLACRSGVVPDTTNMMVLSDLASATEARFGVHLPIVSGGNSANLTWALNSADTGRINDLRLGESILLGRETLHRQPVGGLHTDAITFVAEVIESKLKPSAPWGDLAQTAFGTKADTRRDGDGYQTILAAGHQDTDPAGLDPPPGVDILGASSDHLIVDCGQRLTIGSEVRFQPNYSALLRSMTSPFVAKVLTGERADARPATPLTSTSG